LEERRTRKETEFKVGWSWVPVTPVIPATWEAEIRKIENQGQLRQVVLETPISQITREKRTGV
jgi:hypothetical protein